MKNVRHHDGSMDRLSIDLGPDIHDWLQASVLGPLIGATPNAVNVAGLKDGTANGYPIRRRAATSEDYVGGLPRAIKFLFTVPREEGAPQPQPQPQQRDDSLADVLKENAALRAQLADRDKQIARYQADAAKVDSKRLDELQAENDELKQEAHAARDFVLHIKTIVGAEFDPGVDPLGLDLEKAIEHLIQRRRESADMAEELEAMVERLESRCTELYQTVQDLGGNSGAVPVASVGEVKRLRSALWNITRYLASNQRHDAANVATDALRESYEGVQ